MSDDLKIYAVSHVRTCTVKGEPRTVIWAITSGDETRHYSLDIDDFVGLTKQMQADAHLLTEKGPFSGPLSAN